MRWVCVFGIVAAAMGGSAYAETPLKMRERPPIATYKSARTVADIQRCITAAVESEGAATPGVTAKGVSLMFTPTAPLWIVDIEDLTAERQVNLYSSGGRKKGNFGRLAQKVETCKTDHE